MPSTHKRKKMLWGICGVGMGHAYRQLPVIEHFAQSHQVTILSYSNAHSFYKKHFSSSPNVEVLPIAPPYIPDGAAGIGFREALELPNNQNKDFFQSNTKVLAKLSETIGKPDVVIGDYEPVCAQYAYAYDAPLITFDQQSKYLCGAFPPTIDGHDYRGEVMRLQMFYPKAAERIACSFFRFKSRDSPHSVTIVPPIIRPEVQDVNRKQTINKTLLVYLSEYPHLSQAVSQLNAVATQTKTTIKVFAKGASLLDNVSLESLSLHEPDQTTFLNALASCSGIICTAGHSLLSEAMYLGIPVYALPRKQYEALLCARIIADNDFGMSHTSLTKASVSEFIRKLPTYQINIQKDKNNTLLRTDGTNTVIKRIAQQL